MFIVTRVPAHEVANRASYTDALPLGMCRLMRDILSNGSLDDAEPEKRIALCAISVAYGA
jgi:hypothetical protein